MKNRVYPRNFWLSSVCPMLSRGSVCFRVRPGEQPVIFLSRYFAYLTSFLNDTHVLYIRKFPYVFLYLKIAYVR